MNRFIHIFIAARKHCKLATDKDGKPTSPLPTSPSAQGQGGTRGKLSSPPPSSSALPVIVPTPRQMLFDWEYLQGSLRLLQALGRHYRHLSSIERELLRTLSQMYDWIFSTDNHHRSLSSSQPASSPLPPSTGNLNHKDGNLGLLASSSSSAVEAAEGEEGSHFAANTTPISLIWVRTLLKDQPTERAELRGFLRVFTRPVLPGDLLKGPFRSASSQAAEARRLIFDVCMSLVRDRIQTVPSLQTWVAAPEEGAGKDIHDLSSAAYYSNLPQSYITQVGEHILSLIQHLEDFAASDALGEVSAVMGGLERLIEVDWRKSGQVLGMSEAEISSLITSTATTREDQEQGKEEEEDGMMRFCNAWLSSISQATTAVLVTAVASIPRLTSRGSRQLQTDAAYLLTVLDNLEVKPHPALNLLHEIAGLKEEELAERIENRGSDSSVSTSNGGGASSLGLNAMTRNLERKLAASRGLVISFHG